MSMWLRIRRCLWVRWFEHKLKRGRKRQCKAVGYNCAECVYHEFLLDNEYAFKGVNCLYFKMAVKEKLGGGND